MTSAVQTWFGAVAMNALQASLFHEAGDPFAADVYAGGGQVGGAPAGHTEVHRRVNRARGVAVQPY